VSSSGSATRGSTAERLVEAGLEAFLAKSYDAVGIQELCSAVGVPKGSFYHWFDSKLAFGVAVVEHSTQRYVGWIEGELGRDERPPLARLAQLLADKRRYLDEHDYERPCLAAKMGVERHDLAPELREAILSGQRRINAVFATCFEEALERGELPAGTCPADFAAFFRDALEGAVTRAQLERDGEPLERLRRNLFPGVEPAAQAI
jgi:TetR/AcrR family transcriptional regulator, transcriptional repressor for nem operon